MLSLIANIGRMRQIRMVDLQKQYLEIKSEIDAAILNVVQSSDFINGKEVKNFSANLSNFLDVKHVIPCANGTDALMVALMSLNLEKGAEIITSAFSFIATVEVIVMLGFRPLLVDLRENSFNLDERRISEIISPKTRAIMPVHLFGLPCEMDLIQKEAKAHNLFVIEDNAQSIGASYDYNNDQIGGSGIRGDIACTSFYPSKNLSCFGDGGAVYTNNDRYANRLKEIVNHGSKRKYFSNRIGVNSRLDTIQAAVLTIKLKKLTDYISRRRIVAREYENLLGEVEQIVLPQRYDCHVWHQYTIRVKECRDDLKDYLAERGIPSMIYYPLALHLQEPYRHYFKGRFPIAEKMTEEVLSLPMHPELGSESISYICEEIKSYFHR